MELSVTLQRLMKADFLHGVGIAVGRSDVSFAHMTKRFMTVSLRHARTVSLPESGRERLDEFDHTLNNFLQDIDTTPDQVVLSLPRHMAYVSRVVVPESSTARQRRLAGAGRSAGDRQGSCQRVLCRSRGGRGVR